jgi:hypothetical protein
MENSSILATLLVLLQPIGTGARDTFGQWQRDLAGFFHAPGEAGNAHGKPLMNADER